MPFEQGKPIYSDDPPVSPAEGTFLRKFYAWWSQTALESWNVIYLNSEYVRLTAVFAATAVRGGQLICNSPNRYL
jgi:hypothetical protein